MKTIVGTFLLAALLIAAGLASLAESRRTRQVALARERLMTLHYDADDGVTGEPPALALPIARLDDTVRQQRAVTSYWRTQYEDLIKQFGSVMTSENDAVMDPRLLFVTANARFRASRPELGDRQAAVERLDTVIQAYADVLRLDPAHADAAYNYEYVGRLRDLVARSRGARARPTPVAEGAPSVDLPPGPTLHGRPGGPPPEVSMDQFKTLTPMSFEEREETDPGAGPLPRRKG
jgi:hypothetical protein